MCPTAPPFGHARRARARPLHTGGEAHPRRPPLAYRRPTPGPPGVLSPVLPPLPDVEKTATIMIFVSKGYFKSTNCLREADCTVKQSKHITLMHDPVKGGATLDFIKENECPERLLKPIFTCPDGVTPRKVITWHRIKDFQLVSLKLLTEQMLLGCATYANLPELPLYLPGEISAKKLMFSKKVRCHTAAPKRSHSKCSHSEYSHSPTPTRTPTPASLACVQVVM